MRRKRAVCDECGGEAQLIVVDVGDRQAEILCWGCLINRLLYIVRELAEPVTEEQVTEDSG